jgi:protein-tyrosine-phosphatase
MAEAWANHFGEGKVEAHSAGMYPFGSIAEDTYTVMSEKGISLDGQCSKGLRDVPVTEMDVVVGMGREVECPTPAGFKGRIVDWEIPDPFGRGIETFRNVRDMIERQVQALITDLIASDVSG